jgi:hypothetical protein
MTHRALVTQKSAPIYSDFARPFLERHFSPAVVAALFETLPRYSRGPRKGLLRGYVHWVKCERGGWYRTGPSYYDTPTGHVMRPGSHKIRVCMDRDPQSRCVLDQEANATDEMRIAAILGLAVHGEGRI